MSTVILVPFTHSDYCYTKVDICLDTRSDDEPVYDVPYKNVFLNPRLMMAAAANGVANIALTAADPLLEPELRNWVRPQNKEGILPVATLSIVLYVSCWYRSESDVAPEVTKLSSALLTSMYLCLWKCTPLLQNRQLGHISVATGRIPSLSFKQPLNWIQFIIETSN